MVQMALQEIVCNGVKTDNIEAISVHNVSNKYEEACGKETDGKDEKEKVVEEGKTAIMLVAHEEEQSLDNMLVNSKSQTPVTNDLSCLLDESTDIFSTSFLSSTDAMIEEKNKEKDRLEENYSPTVEKPIEEHDCLLHPYHLSLINKLEASKNTISNLEESIRRLEKSLSEETNRNDIITQLERTIEQHEKEIQLYKQEHEIDQRTITSLKKEMETKLSAMKKQYETANKEKENMVMRYAVSEKELLDCKKEKDVIDKKMKEVIKENESSLTKLKTVTSEKLKVSQQLDSKVSEISNAYKEIDKLKEEINSRDIKIKWTQNKLKSEMDSHKECSVTFERLNSNIKTLESELEKYRQEINSLNLQLEKQQTLEKILKELQSKLNLESPEITEFFRLNKTLKSEFQALLMENNLISHQINNVEEILTALDSEFLKDDTLNENNTSVQTNSSTKKECLMNLLKETQHILSEVSHLRIANEKILSEIATCQAKSVELLSFSPLKITDMNDQFQANVGDLEQKSGNDLNLDGNHILIRQLKNRIAILEHQLAEEKENKEAKLNTIARTEEILIEVDRLRSSNEELISDVKACKVREADLLAFTQKLTTKNVKLQSEFSAVESKANELEITERNHAETELQLKITLEQLKRNLDEEKERRLEETRLLARQVAEKTAKVDNLLESVTSLQSELSLVKNKHCVQVKELHRELSQYRRKIEQLESTATGSAGSTANSLTSGSKSTTSSLSSLNDSPVLQGIDVPAQVLVERIVKLQQESAKQNDRIEFLEEHSAQLVKELQKKSRLLQNYIMREQTGTLTSNSMDRSKAELSKTGGIMASLYGTKPADETMTFELCLEINRKLQAVLEDTLLKNITLKENIDTLGDEIARLTTQPKSS